MVNKCIMCGAYIEDDYEYCVDCYDYDLTDQEAFESYLEEKYKEE